MCSTRRREDTHELLKRVEGLRVSLKFGGDVIQIDEVGRERRVVVRKVPLPGCASLNENSKKCFNLLEFVFSFLYPFKAKVKESEFDGRLIDC